MRRVLPLFAFLVCAVAASAQELDVFDANDFLDPRDRGAVFLGTDCGFLVTTRCGLEQRGANFHLFRIYTGRVADYQWRNEATDADLSFVHLTASRYVANRQLNVKLTAFQGEEESALPRYRGTLQFGYYFLTAARPGEQQNEEHRVSNRLLATYSIEENRFTGAGQTHQYNHELGLELDLYVKLRTRSVIGSLIWVRRYVGEEGSVHRVTYFYRGGNFRYGPVRLNTSVGIGGEKTESWHWGVARAVLTASVEIPKIDTSLNFAYAPSYRPGADSRRTHHELSVYLDRTLWARLRQ